MILFAVEAFQKYPNLKADLQERFQYIMIDEFQDTNDSQFELILQLAKDVSNNGNANVLAVGDDDQAIYKFQGAKLNNIYSFVNNFPGRHVIVLDKNYRSTQEILDFARNVIIKAEDRLETRDININKKIKAENLKYLEKKVGEIKIEKFDSELHEFNFIGQELSKLLKQGIDPKEIAIICRKHEQLKNLANVLNNFRVPYSYSKRENILEKPHIHELITIIRFLCMQQDGDGDELLPEILSYKFWDLERIDIWRVAEKVRRGKEIETDLPGKTDWKRVSWIEAMHDSENKKLRDIANFLIKLTEDSRTTPIEFLLDEIIGTTEFLWEDSEYDDTLTPRSSPAKDFVSPYKKYYFNEKIFERNRPQYLDFLFSLRTFIGALREFSAEHILKAKNIMDFVEMYNGNHLTLSYVSPFSSSENAVSLLTAHSAKGLEFEYVFLLSADSSVWSRAGRSNKISFPINMPLTPEGENDDDKIRLLYVALTRAKHTLYITHSGNRVEFLASDDEETPPDLSFEKGREMEQMSQEFLNSFNLVPTREFVQDEKLLLKRLLENYKMPVTHLNNFLNFTRVGPSKFLENNILRFPQAKTPSSAYGSAMHDAVERYFLHFKKYGKVPDLDFVKSAFKN
jgi:DNA helicase-2/ATP-dependent DNA helicase PcrA